MNATDKILMNSISPAIEMALITARVGATRKDEICKKLEIFMKRKLIAQNMIRCIIATTQDMIHNSKSQGSGYSEYCALYLSVCNFVRANHLNFFESRFYKDEYYAMRMVIKEYVLLPSHNVKAHIWALQHGINQSDLCFGMSCTDKARTYYHRMDQVEMYGDDEKPFAMCGCHDSERISDETNELIAFEQWGPGMFVDNVFVTQIDYNQIWAFTNNGTTATIWTTYNPPENMSRDDFSNQFENDMADRHFAWKHDMASIFKLLRNYNTMFSSPQLPDYSQIMLQIQAKTNVNCMCLIDEFCGVFENYS